QARSFAQGLLIGAPGNCDSKAPVALMRTKASRCFRLETSKKLPAGEGQRRGLPRRAVAGNAAKRARTKPARTGVRDMNDARTMAGPVTTTMRPIEEIAAAAGFFPEEVEPYGRWMAKVSLRALERLKDRPNGKLIYTTAITATPAGEGKTTIAIGLTQALGVLGKRAAVALREPSMGPVFGIKGGATGGGRARIVPEAEINLHFTGDIHAVGAAHNLLAAMIDNHIYHGNELGIDPRTVVWPRVLDVNDRQLRHIVVGLGGTAHGVPRETRFDITVASEVMAILCLAESIEDLKERLGRIYVGRTYDGKPVFARDLGAVNAMAAIL